MTKVSIIPFGLLDLEEINMSKRGYKVYPKKIIYAPTTQISDLLTLGGDTEPTTTSNCAETTGFIHTDSDEANDDKGTD